MNKTDKKPNLSTCLENVQRALARKSVSSELLARTVCEKHNPQGSEALYGDILSALPPDSEKGRPFEEWLALLLDSCSEDVTVLHTDLTLLLIARHSPTIAAAFSQSPGKTPESIDTMLRKNLNEFIADVHADHEIVSREEFWELIANIRKTDACSETRGRDNAAIVYSDQGDLTHVEEWATKISERACVPLRMRLDAKDLDQKLAATSLEPLLGFRGTERKSAILAKKLASATQSAVSSSLGSTEILKAWQSTLENGTFIGHRLVLVLELENVDANTIASVNKWLADAVAPRHDRLIVVVGGISVNTELEHPQGTWAYRLKPAVKTEGVSQAIANDLAGGTDLLALTQEIDAISDAIASVEFTPPLVVGICGGWGAGKSFVLDLIDRRLREIRKQDVPQEDALHAGHIYWIEFDAWTYSKKNLWASLMDQICRQFEEQLNIERIQFKDRHKTKPRIAADIPPWVVRKELMGVEPSDLDKHTGWTVALANDSQNLGELLVSINEDGFVESQAKLTGKLKDAHEKESSLTKDRESFLERELPARVSRDFVRSISVKLLKALGIDEKTLDNLGEIPQVVAKLEEDRATFKRLWGAIQSPYIFPIILIGLGALALSPSIGYEWTLPTGVMSLVTSVGLAISRVLSAREKIHDHIAKGLAELDQSREAARKALTEEYDRENKFNDELKDCKELQKNLQKELDELRSKSGAPFLKLEELQDFLEKIRNSDVYANQLGLMNKVQRHLQKLSQLVTGWSKHHHDPDAVDTETYSPFMRGTPRIVLKIDDLDRCPPRKVVEVLEAAQLLVKTDLFVVLLALDLRYVTRAIEKRYDGILSHEEHPTGLDYIEKIIQLPYRVRPIAEDHLKPFFSGHLDYIPDTPVDEIKEEETHLAPVGEIPARTIHIPERPLLRQVLQLKEPEFNDLVEACKPLDLSPRAGKRIGNVYKIWKLLWYQRGEEPSLDQGLKRAMVALLALSTVRPRLARHGLRQLTHSIRSNKNKRKLLNTVFHDLAKDLGEPPHIQDIFASKRMFPKTVKVGDLALQDLSMLASFSFVGDDDLKGKQNGAPPTAERRPAPRTVR